MDVNAINKALDIVREQIVSAADLHELDALKKQFMNDVVAPASKQIGTLAPEMRSSAGKVLSEAKQQFEEFFTPVKEKLAQVEQSIALESERVDVTAVEQIVPLGARHPLSVLQEDIAEFFRSISWRIAQGPEVDAEWYNFDALNFGVDHPARQMQDTFYLEKANQVLRTHTSPVQVRSMLENGVPLYIACPGKVYRTDELDATHTPVFHQCEGLAIDKDLSMANLKGTIDAFAKKMFGSSAKTRLRPSYFPFTEPSAEMDVWYENKKGGAGWIEWGGCGMVNPNVLKSCGIDPEVYSGFAFGMGLERTLMLRHNIQDMHDIVEGDVRFSRQFGFES
ncbi:MAG: phenylalanine--tRNA ligase subunit alpha [Candidatus Ancillula sp.]|jgi:phenylalanyl-tRNA synthetase alpha chain|nr:phenylalanine--tRNA ligase subunit alpha [Candidatus Ancillula sp.]